MGDMQVIVQTERRRKWGDVERTRILAECDRPGTTIRQVAERHDVAESLIYGWRAARRKSEALAAQPMAFIDYGEITARPGADAVYTPPLPISQSVAAGPASPIKAAVKLPSEEASPPRPSFASVHSTSLTPARPAELTSPAMDDTDLLRPHPGDRPGNIEVQLPTGARLTVDTYVNERALMRVVSVLMDAGAREKRIQRRMAGSTNDAARDKERTVPGARELGNPVRGHLTHAEAMLTDGAEG